MPTLPRTAALAAALFALAACDTIDTDAERAVVGAGGGAVAAEAFGADPVAGAVAGGAAGAFCDDFGIC